MGVAPPGGDCLSVGICACPIEVRVKEAASVRNCARRVVLSHFSNPVSVCCSIGVLARCGLFQAPRVNQIFLSTPAGADFVYGERKPTASVASVWQVPISGRV